MSSPIQRFSSISSLSHWSVLPFAPKHEYYYLVTSNSHPLFPPYPTMLHTSSLFPLPMRALPQKKPTKLHSWSLNLPRGEVYKNMSLPRVILRLFWQAPALYLRRCYTSIGQPYCLRRISFSRHTHLRALSARPFCTPRSALCRPLAHTMDPRRPIDNEFPLDLQQCAHAYAAGNG